MLTADFRHFRARKLIALFIVGMSSMPFKPLPGDLMPRCGLIKLSHKSSFFTGFRSTVRQWLARQRGNHSVMPWRRYSESVNIVISQASLSAVRAERAAWSSIRLLVVARSEEHT